MKGERMAKRSSFGNIMRRRLSDITNTQAQHKLVGLMIEQSQISESNEDLINQLLQVKQEKEMLLKLVEERNKIIELSGNKLRDLRMNYQKLQAQKLESCSIKQPDELNLGREKVSSFETTPTACHEFWSFSLWNPGKAEMNCQNVVSQEVEKIEEEECVPGAANNDIKHCSRCRRRTARSRSMGPSTTNRQTVEKEKAETKRLVHFHCFLIKQILNTSALELGLEYTIPLAMRLKLCKRCVRRQSAASRSQEREPAENLFEIEDVRFPVSNSSDKSLKENGPTSSSITKEEICKPSNEAQVSHRSSIGRPSRRAAEKVQSYKEVPLNVKMRRE
ncbi:SHUGOSHIN 2-like [Populus alba x Populus x berolinensis]|uniref:SHUGOSHIN 2-like n=1 Tax=Populus alba x Populus x berolinensis TaxID=444605 RepID=A0AAD6MEK0_9ROSI|nr:SHUGOSHIN 2-like [Populus alba x Populus x berolinensis]